MLLSYLTVYHLSRHKMKVGSSRTEKSLKRFAVPMFYSRDAEPGALKMWPMKTLEQLQDPSKN